MNRSLRLRLTLLYSGFFTVLFVLLAAVLYGAIAHSLTARVEETLAAEAETAAGLFADEYQEVGKNAEAAAREVVSDMKLRGGGIRIVGGEKVLAANPAAGGAEVRSAERSVTVDGVAYRIAVSASMSPVEAALTQLRRSLAIGLPVALLLAGFGTWMVATRALNPLTQVASQAHGITEHNLETRIKVNDPAAELVPVVDGFNELLARLDTSFASMRRFVADASHELRTPVSIIRGEADVALSRERSAAEYRESLAVVLDESRRLSLLVEDLLNLARADSGRVTLDSHEFYLNELLADCCRSMQSQATSRGVILECAASPDLQYRGDEHLLWRMLLNLIDNAIRYTPAEGRVAVGIDHDEGGVRIWVTDTGIGIAAEHLPRIFERFYRADEGRNRAAGGFGLGLSIVKWIAEAHGGLVACESRPGGGSRFTVSLPNVAKSGDAAH